MKLEIDIDRLNGELDTLAGFSDVPAPAVTRVVYSEQDRRAREYVCGLCKEAGLVVREDPVGNLSACWVGREPELAAVATGSHIDAIPNAGRYDGTVGVLGGLEALRALQRSGLKPRRSLDLLIFSAEEPTRFGIGCFGSRLMADCLSAAAVRDKEGKSLDEWRTEAGYRGDLDTVALPAGAYSAFVELHIEQGPLLEAAGIPVGIVTAIAAPASWRIAVEGTGGHAGALLMKDRHDAFCAAAEITLAVERAARSTGSDDTVGTVGVCDIFPGAVNSVPVRTRMEIDVRDIDGTRRDGVLARVRQACAEVARARGVTIKIEELNADPPAQCDGAIVEALVEAAEVHGLAFQKMVSRAYHDSLFMSRIAPTAMVFIPCRDGVSHRPDEYASPEAIAAGTLVLAETLGTLAER